MTARKNFVRVKSMDLLIEQIFNLSSGLTVFACQSPSQPIPKKSKFQAFIKSKDSEKVGEPFTVFRELVKRTTNEPDASVAFASSNSLDLKTDDLLRTPHFLVIQ